MKKILIVDTTLPINTRTERFRSSFKQHFDVVVAAWNRGESSGQKEKEKENFYILNSNLGYGNQIKKTLFLPFFFIHIYLVCIKEKPDTIFASHWDSLVCAVLIKLTWNWRVKIIYDCLDLPTFSNYLIRKFIFILERSCLKFVNLTIFASRYFEPLYSKKLNSYIFENYPSIDLLGVETREPNWLTESNSKLLENKNNIAWIGVVRYLNIIENILLSIKGTNVNFFVFGDGPELENLKKAVDFHGLKDQVVFLGRYKTSDIRYIYEKSNLVWAAYPTDDYNAVYAISNKYFECSFFEKKIILSYKTKMAQDLLDNPNVILVDEYSSSDINKKILSNIDCNVGDYQKYADDVSWESKEKMLIDFIVKTL